MASLIPRWYDDCYYNDGTNCRSNWDRWGRWVAFAVIVVIAFFIFFSFACINARRRRARGRQPFTGTAWMAPPPGPPPPNQPYYNEGYYPNQPPPQYSANPQQYGYFGAQAPPPQQTGIELQQPPHTYNASGARDYAPPPGPPPAKA